MAVLALVLLAVAVAVPAVRGYELFKRDFRPDDVVHTVRPGQAYSFGHVSWRAEVTSPDTPPPGVEPPAPGRVWVEITVTRVALDAEGALLSHEPTVELRDRAGRRWVPEIVNSTVPLEARDNRIGVEYRYNARGLVPREVAGEVELYLRPSPARKDRPAPDTPGPTAGTDLDVLRFTR